MHCGRPASWVAIGLFLRPARIIGCPSGMQEYPTGGAIDRGEAPGHPENHRKEAGGGEYRCKNLHRFDLRPISGSRQLPAPSAKPIDEWR